MVKEYIIKPITHTKLLNGQELYSCTKAKLTDSYYSFTYEHKVNKADKGSFLCGKPTGEHFLKLLNHPPIDIFNPLKSNSSGTTPSTSPVISNGNGNEVWDPVALELHNAINLLIICWGNRPIKGPLAKIKSDLDKYKRSSPYTSKIKSINTILGYNNKTLKQMVEDLRVNNPNLKDYSFENINKILESENIPSNFD